MLGGNGEVTKLLKELISEVRKGGNVYLDGNKVGYALALNNLLKWVNIYNKTN